MKHINVKSISIYKEYKTICIELSYNEEIIHCMINEFIHQTLIIITKHEKIISEYDNNYVAHKTYININEKHEQIIKIISNKLKIIKDNKNRYDKKFIRWMFQ